MLKNILEKIIKITAKDDSHVKFTFFNFIKFSTLKLSFRKRYYETRQIFNHYKKNNLDITTYPKATGILRDLQLAELELLKEFDYVCKTAGFDYWLDFGTLLGAVRHKGFIPWDDDIDVSMPREYYNQIIETFNNLTRNKNMQARYLRKGKKISNYFIRLEYINTPLFLDIFPYDFYGEILTEEKRNELNENLKQLRYEEINRIVWKKGLQDEEIKEKIETLKNKILVNGYHTKESKTDLVWGVDFNHLWKQWFHSYDTIYPIKTTEFEGLNFNCPNNCDKHLKIIFGDYMSYPTDAKHSHMAYRLTETQLKTIQDCINKE